MELSPVECASIAEKYFGQENFDFLEYRVVSSDDVSLGLIGNSQKLVIQVRHDGKVKELKFFYKSLPKSQLHREIVLKTRCFDKEASYYNVIHPKIEKYQKYKSIPNCYLADQTRLVVEDLSITGFKNHPLFKFFDLEHCKIVLKHLADVHASSMLYEKENQSIYNQFQDLMYVSWYSHKENHPGNIHMNTGITALQAVIQKHLHNYSPEIQQKAVAILRKIPETLRPSDKFKNCIAHCDLWCNNIMFKYDNGVVKECKLIDFQLFAYNPPALDVLTLIFTTTSEMFRKRHLSYLLDYYYGCISNNFKRFNYAPEEIYPESEYKTCVLEFLPAAIATGALFLQYVLLPEQKLLQVMSDTEKIKQFMFVDRNEFVLNTVETDTKYNEKILMALRALLDYVKDNLTNK